MTHTFPSVQDLAEIDPIHLVVPKTRQRTLSMMVDAIADRRVNLDAGFDWTRAREQLLDIPGVGPWTAEVIAMRGLGDPDAFPVADLGVRLAAKQLGLPQRQPDLLDAVRAGVPGVRMQPNTFGPHSSIR